MGYAFPHRGDILRKMNSPVNNTNTVIACRHIAELITNILFPVIIIIVHIVSTKGGGLQIIGCEIDIVYIYVVNFINTRMEPVGDKNVCVADIRLFRESVFAFNTALFLYCIQHLNEAIGILDV